MNTDSKLSLADAMDRFLQLMVLSLFFVAVLFGLSVVEHFTSGSTADTIEMTIKIVAVLIVVTILGAFIWKARRLPGNQVSSRELMEGFLQGVFQEALAKSWMFLFIILSSLSYLDNLVLSRLPDMPVDVLLQAILTLMLLSLCSLFVLLSRVPATND